MKLPRFFFIFLLFILSTSSASAAPRGDFKATDAYCTNSNYKFDPDEQAYIDSVRGEGSCKSGRPMDMLCFSDYYSFGAQGKGQHIVVTQATPDAGCIIRTPLSFSEKKRGLLEVSYGRGVSESYSSDPNVQLSCGDKENQPDEVKGVLRYRTAGADVLIIMSQDAECGEFILKLTPSSLP